MSRRRPPAEPGFGSDSFLDIIANIVGILIILIVVAGVRVGQAPVDVPTPDEVTAPVSPPVEVAQVEPPAELPIVIEPVTVPPEISIPEASEPEPSPPVIVDATPAPAWLTSALFAETDVPPERPPVPVRPPAVAEPRPLRIKQPSQELLTRIQSLRQSLTEYAATLNALRQQQVQLNAEITKTSQDATATVQLQAALKATQEQQRRQLLNIEREYARVEAEFIGKQLALDSIENTQPTAKTIRHQLTPVGRVVEGDELHFHLKGGRIAYVPLEELIERMKTQVKRQKDWVLRTGRLKGRIGPQDGFHLDYLVAKQSMSALDEARLGGGYARVTPVLLEFVPEDRFYAETASEALNPVSMFVRRLRMSPQNATLTFWVYPDSFQLYRELKEFAHEEGFTVAARPLQNGDVISASPFGSRSVGQ